MADPVGFFAAMAEEQGSVARVRFGSQEFVLLNEPALIEEILVRQSPQFEKFPRIARTKGLFGEGLLTSEEPLHLKQRRLAQPAFHREKLALYSEEMVAATLRLTADWSEHSTRNTAHDMGVLALDIVSRTLFSTQTNEESERISSALDEVVRTLNHLVTPWGNLLLGLPTPLRRRYREALKTLDDIIYGFIAERRQHPVATHDLLAMLLEARDIETGETMPDLQLRDELMTMFVAGHDTTANALTWTLYLLAEHPEERGKVEAELDAALNGKTPTMDDVGNLPHLTAAFRESLRLYPPVWILGRRALTDITNPVLPLRKGTIVLVSTAVLHRRKELFSDPDSFRPGRLEPSHRYAFLPFGAGSRLCIGERFAWLEGVLCLATILQHWRLDRSSREPVVPQPLLTLRPQGGLPMVLHRRYL